MAESYANRLASFKGKHDFFIGIDSDGCAFDTMEIKHKECFIPNIIKHLGLQAVSKYAREAAEFVNLYSRWRGINRFPALEMTLDLLEERREVRERHVTVPRLAAMRDWIAVEPKPSNPALETAIRAADDGAGPELKRVLDWSQAVNAAIADMVRGVPPFPWVRESLEEAFARADIIVVSATPTAALEQEWAEHDIARYAALIAGQEMGKKAEHLQRTTQGPYARSNVLMIGDARGDFEAARANGALFYPINPGAESESWEQFAHEALDRFFAGRYAGDYEASLIARFEALLPGTPPWKCWNPQSAHSKD